jgi:hypothetical protein
MLHRYLKNVGRGCGYDDGQQGKPGNPGLIKVTDSEEADNVGEESGTQDPEVPFLVTISFY